MPLQITDKLKSDQRQSEKFLVVCLCAEWCGICREYKTGFEALKTRFPDTRFCWVDVEDHAEVLGELEIESFPMIVAWRRELVLFYGSIQPHLSHLSMLIAALGKQTREESEDYVQSTPERRAWQEDAELLRLGELSELILEHES